MKLAIIPTFKNLGKFDEAKIYYKKTLELDKNFTKADRGIAMLEKYNSSNDHIKIMEKKLKDEKLHKNNIIDLSFALGKVYEDLKDYQKSFFYIVEANKLKKSLLNSKIYFWLTNQIKNQENREIYFGNLSSIIHNSLLDDPKPYRKNIKELQTNLYTYLKAFLEDEIIIDVPYEKSERIRLKN